MEEPAAEGAKDKSNFGREREVGGHADEDAEHEASDRADPDCGSGTQGAHPIDPRHGFPCEAPLLVQSGYLTGRSPSGATCCVHTKRLGAIGRLTRRLPIVRSMAVNGKLRPGSPPSSTPLSARHLPWLAWVTRRSGSRTATS
jgi:hypothetical protein